MLKVEILRESVYKRDRKKCIRVIRVPLVGVVERSREGESITRRENF